MNWFYGRPSEHEHDNKQRKRRCSDAVKGAVPGGGGDLDSAFRRCMKLTPLNKSKSLSKPRCLPANVWTKDNSQWQGVEDFIVRPFPIHLGEIKKQNVLFFYRNISVHAIPLLQSEPVFQVISNVLADIMDNSLTCYSPRNAVSRRLAQSRTFQVMTKRTRAGDVFTL